MPKLLDDKAAHAAFIARMKAGATAKEAAAAFSYSYRLWYEARALIEPLDKQWGDISGIRRRPGAGRWTPSTTKRFFDALAATGDPAAAALSVDRAATSAQRRRDEDPAFARDWVRAMARAREAILTALMARLLRDERGVSAENERVVLALLRGRETRPAAADAAEYEPVAPDPLAAARARLIARLRAFQKIDDAPPIDGGQRRLPAPE